MFVKYAHIPVSTLLEKKRYSVIEPFIDNVYLLAINDMAKNLGYFKYYSYAYGKVLVELDKCDDGILILQNLVDSIDDLEYETYLTLADAYIKVGRELDAFLLLDGVNQNGRNENIEERLQILYEKLNSGKSDFSSYASSLEEIIKERMMSKFKPEIIKREGPDFSLVNMKGQKVSLIDLRGKVVVLDFGQHGAVLVKSHFQGCRLW